VEAGTVVEKQKSLMPYFATKRHLNVAQQGLAALSQNTTVPDSDG
jgi:hypothetical protein